jgi:hypothetical protein
VRHGEDHVKVTCRKQFLLSRGEPALASLALALRAMPVAAGVIRDDGRTIAAFLAALRTRIEMAAQRRSPAIADGAERFQLLIAKTGSIAVQKTIALRVEDIGHLQGGPAHVSLVRLKP